MDICGICGIEENWWYPSCICWSWGLKRRLMVHQSSAAFVSAKGAFEKVKGESWSMDGHFFQVFDFLGQFLKTSRCEEFVWWWFEGVWMLVSCFVAFGSLILANQQFAIKKAEFLHIYFGDKIGCPHLDCDAKWLYKQPHICLHIHEDWSWPLRIDSKLEVSCSIKARPCDPQRPGRHFSNVVRTATSMHARTGGRVAGLPRCWRTWKLTDPARSACRRQRLKAKAEWGSWSESFEHLTPTWQPGQFESTLIWRLDALFGSIWCVSIYFCSILTFLHITTWSRAVKAQLPHKHIPSMSYWLN